MQLAAIKALYNSLDFIKDNFEREVRHILPSKKLHFTYAQGERNYIMQVVCEATQNQAVEVQAAAFETLVRIMSLYYDKMSYYMERALFGVWLLSPFSFRGN